MSNKTFIEKLIERTPLAFVILGSILFIVGAAGGAQYLKVQVNEMGWRIALAAMGVVLCAVGSLVLWREKTITPSIKHSDFGIRIDNPKTGEEVGEMADVRGSYSKEPPEGALRLFVLSNDERNIWPQESVRTFNKKEKRWSGRVHIGGPPNHTKVIRAAIIGQPSRIMCDYYHEVGEKTNWQPIHEWPEEAIEYVSIIVKKI